MPGKNHATHDYEFVIAGLVNGTKVSPKVRCKKNGIFAYRGAVYLDFFLYRHSERSEESLSPRGVILIPLCGRRIPSKLWTTIAWNNKGITRHPDSPVSSEWHPAMVRHSHTQSRTYPSVQKTVTLHSSPLTIAYYPLTKSGSNIRLLTERRST